MNELITNSNIFINNLITYILPTILVFLTLVSYSGIIQKLTVNLEKIVSALKDFLSIFEKPKIKISLLVVSIVYLVIEFLIFVVI